MGSSGSPNPANADPSSSIHLSPQAPPSPAPPQPIAKSNSTDNKPAEKKPHPFRLRKRYYDNQPSPPSPNLDPDAFLSPHDTYQSKNHQGDLQEENPAIDDAHLLAPFPNISSFELGDWFYGQGSQKSLKDFQALVKILTSPSFSLDDIRSTKWTSVFQDLGKNKEDISPAKSEWVDDSGWKTTEVKIDVPVHHWMDGGHGVERHRVGTLHHRSIVSIIEEKIRNSPDSQFLHLDGHEVLWQPDEKEGSAEFRVISELYHSDAFLRAEREIRDNPPLRVKNCPLPRVVIGIQLWSDATHLSTFSTSKLWPIYLVFGNKSKYRRGKSTTDPCHHIAYLDSVSNLFGLKMQILIPLAFCRYLTASRII